MFRLLGRYIFREILTSACWERCWPPRSSFCRRSTGCSKCWWAATPIPRPSPTLFALTLPPVLPLTIPFGVLVGILIGLGRMASDGEITAMRAAGVSSRSVIAPVLVFAVMGAALAGLASLRLTPYSLRKSTEILNRLIANQISAEIQPRIFDEDFPNTILYVGDVRPGDPVVWRPVFMADVTAPDKRKSGLGEKADGPMITVARLALATSDTQEQPHPAPDARLFHARDGEGRSGPRRGRARQDHRARPAAARAAGPGVERHEHAAS